MGIKGLGGGVTCVKQNPLCNSFQVVMYTCVTLIVSSSFQGGTCVDDIASFTCECLSGFAGTRCETEIVECTSTPCLNGARCLDMIGRYECRCVPGFEGVNCEISIDECLSSPCRNGGRDNDDL